MISWISFTRNVIPFPKQLKQVLYQHFFTITEKTFDFSEKQNFQKSIGKSTSNYINLNFLSFLVQFLSPFYLLPGNLLQENQFTSKKNQLSKTFCDHYKDGMQKKFN